MICGVDEAGRGPLAGPVYAAAVILDPRYTISGIRDSKQLTAKARTALALEIKAHARSWSLGCASVEEIDALNILQASLLAMRRAVEGLSLAPVQVLVDGLHCPNIFFPVRAIVKGDSSVMEIGAASILAKTERDAHMHLLHQKHGYYGFDQNKGYPTREHIAALRRHGACVEHRRSFAPVREVLIGSL